MSMNRWVYRVSDGQFCFGAGPDPAIYLTDQVNYGLAAEADVFKTIREFIDDKV